MRRLLWKTAFFVPGRKSQPAGVFGAQSCKRGRPQVLWLHSREPGSAEIVTNAGPVGAAAH